jgi:hypothetical protein
LREDQITAPVIPAFLVMSCDAPGMVLERLEEWWCRGGGRGLIDEGWADLDLFLHDFAI